MATHARLKNEFTEDENKSTLGRVVRREQSSSTAIELTFAPCYSTKGKSSLFVTTMLLFVIFDEKKSDRSLIFCNFSGFLAIGTYVVTYGAGEKSCCQWCRFAYLWCYCLWCNLVTKSKSSCQWWTLAFGAVTPRLKSIKGNINDYIWRKHVYVHQKSKLYTTVAQVKAHVLAPNIVIDTTFYWLRRGKSFLTTDNTPLISWDGPIDFLVHLSRRLIRELIVQAGIRRPSVSRRPSSVNIFKWHLLWSHEADLKFHI